LLLLYFFLLLLYLFAGSDENELAIVSKS